MVSSLHIIGSRHSGGAERYYVWLIRALAERGHRVSAINRPGSMVSEELKSAVPQLHIPMRNSYDVLSRWRISRAVRDLRPDIVLTYMSRATGLTHIPRGRGAVHVARLGGFYKIRYFRHAHAWVGVTRGLCDYMVREGLPAERVFYIPSFVDAPITQSEDVLSGLRGSLGIPGDALVVFSLGRFIRKKGFDILLSAFSRLPRAIGGRPVHLVVAGDGELMGDLKKHSAELGIGDRVSWPGWQSDPDPYYDISDVVVFPSRFEPHGNVIKEAWSHRKALVSTETDGASELLSDGSTGLLVPSEDPESLARSMLLVLKDDALRGKLASGGYERVRGDFSKDFVVGRYTEVFEQLLAADSG
jgi:glycosyltransferase involved in cell wall biosynthesis